MALCRTSHSPALGGTSSSIPALYLCGQLFFCLIHSSCPCLCPATTPITTDTKRKENSQPLGRIKSPYKGIQATGSQWTAWGSHAHPSISSLVSYSLPPTTQDFNSLTVLCTTHSVSQLQITFPSIKKFHGLTAYCYLEVTLNDKQSVSIQTLKFKSLKRLCPQAYA